VNDKSIFRFCFLALILVSISFPVSDLSKAMLLARSDRDKVSPIKLIENTLENFNKKELLVKQDLNDYSVEKIYSEKYIKNGVMARLIFTKFHDNSFYFAGRVSDKFRDEILDLSGDLLWTTLPQPLLDILNVDIDKKQFKFSLQDAWVHYSFGNLMSGYKTGTMFAQGLYIFGLFFPIIYFGMCFLMFAALDLFSYTRLKGSKEISIIGLLLVSSFFISGITAESLFIIFVSYTRTLFQTIFLYFILIRVFKFISNLYNLNSSANKSSQLVD
jgi:hypothetical protein